MAVILMEKDPFVEAMESASDDVAFGVGNVRRPLDGILRKPDRSAFLSIYRMDGSQFQHISLLDSSAPSAVEGQGYSEATHNFSLNSITQSRQEKVQIVETFGPFAAFFYGEKPIVLQCQGVLINTADFNWKNEWLQNYDRYLRGTKCVEYKARVYLGFDDVLVQGFILATTVSMNAENPYACPFNFSMLLTAYKDLSEGDSSGYVISGNQARTADGSNFPEYLVDKVSSTYQYVDMATGELKTQSGDSNAPESTDSSRTASWTGDSSGMTLWRDPGSSLSAIDTELAVQQTDGADKVTAQIQRRASPSSFPMASRDDNSETLGNSLSSGVANCACIIDDHPSVG